MSNGNLLDMSVEKMKEAREIAQKEQQELKIEQQELGNKKLSLKLRKNEDFKHSVKRLKIPYYKLKRV